MLKSNLWHHVFITYVIIGQIAYYTLLSTAKYSIPEIFNRKGLLYSSFELSDYISCKVAIVITV